MSDKINMIRDDVEEFETCGGEIRLLTYWKFDQNDYVLKLEVDGISSIISIGKISSALCDSYAIILKANKIEDHAEQIIIAQSLISIAHAEHMRRQVRS